MAFVQGIDTGAWRVRVATMEGSFRRWVLRDVVEMESSVGIAAAIEAIRADEPIWGQAERVAALPLDRGTVRVVKLPFTDRATIAKALPANVAMEVVTQADLARGAALQAQYLMPPGDSSGPSAIPHSVYDIAFLTMSQDNPTGMPKILIPKGSRLPAEFSRTIRFSSQSTRSPALQFVESTQMDGNWHRLGAVEPGAVFPKRLPEQPLQLRTRAANQTSRRQRG